MKRYVRIADYSFTDVLNDPEGRRIVDEIEEAESEIKDRGIDPEDDTEFWVRAKAHGVDELKEKFGCTWR